ncbi:MAG TPA: YidC/Oxa1 family membrane protein insertase [Patescibacteria group bacterium]
MNFLAPLAQIILSILAQLYQVTGDLGIAIIAFTLALRALLIPLTLPSLRAQQKMKELQPELKKLKQKHAGDKQKLQQATMDMYKKYNVNPLAGCLPQLIQIGILIVLYQAMLKFLGQTEVNGISIDPTFLWLNLTQPDPTYVLPVVAAVSQLIMSLMIAPGAETPDIVPNKATSKKVKAKNEKEEDMAEMAASMQQQMLFLMPVMTGFFAARFPAGIALYWVITTFFSIAQQYYISGWGGLITYSQRAYQFLVNLPQSRKEQK